MAGGTGIQVDVEHLIGLRWRLARLSRRSGRGAGPRAGLAPGRRLGRGLDQEDVRAYEPGDDARHIDWRATARLGRVQVKLFREDRERLRVLVVDLRPSMAFGTRRALRSYAAAELAALCGWDAVEDDARLAGVILTGQGPVWLRPGRGPTAALALAGALARHQSPSPEGQEAEPPLQEGLKGLARLARGGAGVVLVSALENPGPRFREELAVLAAAASVAVLRIEDPAERDLPAGLFAWRSAARRGLARLVRPLAGGSDLDDLDRSLRAAGARVAAIATTEDPALALARVARVLHG